jgi:hypothetical protein
VTFELYDGNTATGTPFFTAWAIQGQAFEADRTSPVTEVIISHKGSVDIPGRVAATGTVQYRFRELYAYAEPFSADGFEVVKWEKVSGDVNEVTLTSGVNADNTTNTTGDTWWHSFDYITLRGGLPGSSVLLRATAKDENITNPANKPFAEVRVNVKKPLYLKIPNNPGNATGSTNTYARNMFSPYNFNLDMTLNLEITKHNLDTITGPINVEIWDRANESTTPYITFQVAGLGTHPLKIPAYTLPREEYYKIVAKTANGDALGYEFFRVDGYSDIDWSKATTRNGNNIEVRYTKKNSNVAGTITLAPDAAAYVNGVKCTVSVGTSTSGAGSNTNTLIITGGYTTAATGKNTVDITGVRFAQYPGYTFSVSDTLIK